MFYELQMQRKRQEKILFDGNRDFYYRSINWGKKLTVTYALSLQCKK